MENSSVISAKAFCFRDYSITGISDVIYSIEKHRKDKGIEAIAFEPPPLAEEYLREAVSKKDYDNINLENSGHIIMLIRYALAVQIPVFCLSKNHYSDDIDKIRPSLAASSTLAYAVKEEDESFFEQKLSEQGFQLQ
jgi:hypothetical protein